MHDAVSVRTDHRCAAIGCSARVPANRLLCYPHWQLLPPLLRAGLADLYVPGQEVDHTLVQPGYRRRAREAILVVALADRLLSERAVSAALAAALDRINLPEEIESECRGK